VLHACSMQPPSTTAILRVSPHKPCSLALPVLAATALLSHRVTSDTTIGAEVVRDLAANTTSFAAGEHGGTCTGCSGR